MLDVEKNGDTEDGASVSILEGQATGLPVISSYHADIPEVVVDGKGALLAPEKDVGTLAKHLEYLVEHPDVWEEMGRAGREHVEQEYDVMVRLVNWKRYTIHQFEGIICLMENQK